MENNKLIAIETFCRYYQVEETFIATVHQEGLIDIVAIEDARFIPEANLSVLEKIVRLHQELAINPQGISAVFQLLEKIETLQKENHELKNTLRRFGY